MELNMRERKDMRARTESERTEKRFGRSGCATLYIKLGKMTLPCCSFQLKPDASLKTRDANGYWKRRYQRKGYRCIVCFLNKALATCMTHARRETFRTMTISHALHKKRHVLSKVLRTLG